MKAAPSQKQPIAEEFEPPLQSCVLIYSFPLQKLKTIYCSAKVKNIFCGENALRGDCKIFVESGIRTYNNKVDRYRMADGRAQPAEDAGPDGGRVFTSKDGGITTELKKKVKVVGEEGEGRTEEVKSARGSPK